MTRKGYVRPTKLSYAHPFAHAARGVGEMTSRKLAATALFPESKKARVSRNHPSPGVIVIGGCGHFAPEIVGASITVFSSAASCFLKSNYETHDFFENSCWLGQK